VSAVLCTVDESALADHSRSLTTGRRMSTVGDTDRTAVETAAMRRALELAANGPARGVNPRVGCIILSASGETLAEGWHRGAGTAHAEIDALSRLAPGAAAGATAIVTLEPCNHTGRTGPCAEALLEAGIARVVYAVADPGEHSSGGARHLRDGGVEVDGGLLASEAEAFLGDWLFTARRHRPYVTVKWASSLDGRAAAEDGSSQWITGAAARLDVHRRRAAGDAIAVGTGTVLADDPSLTARDADGRLLDAQPVPVVFGRRAMPAGAALMRHPHGLVTLDGRDLAADLHDLAKRGIRSLFVEGGPTLASAFIAAGYADEVLVYLAPTLLGGDRLALGDLGVASIDEARRYDFAAIERLGDDVLLVAHPRPTEGN
jgi:diaminohydroxyphosphoribosylaminopyrimidine deaminase/5-amino-6-(5-phosphoribosylamino)uracil reductase